MITSCVTIVPYHNQETDIEAIPRTYSVFTSLHIPWVDAFKCTKYLNYKKKKKPNIRNIVIKYFKNWIYNTIFVAHLITEQCVLAVGELKLHFIVLKASVWKLMLLSWKKNMILGWGGPLTRRHVGRIGHPANSDFFSPRVINLENLNFQRCNVANDPQAFIGCSTEQGLECSVFCSFCKL